MQKLSVSASKNYTITITSGSGEFKASVHGLLKGAKVAIITDEIVDSLYENYFDNLLDGYTVFKKVIPSGEKEKNGQNYLALINFLAENGFTRGDTVITFGGGVVGDLGAFVASTYMRGIGLIALPTTLLSMVDSSVGGKTAIDLPSGKNLCGTFYQPDSVYVDVNFLSSLPEREMLSGYGEIIKYAFLSDKVCQSDITSQNFEELILKCLTIKRDIVEQDEKEKNLRKLLNLGHTVGHAIEKMENYSLSHGECVIKGINYAIKVSKALFNIDESTLKKMQSLLCSCAHDIESNYETEDLIKIMKSDKKSGENYVDFVLLKDIAKPEIVRIDFDKLKGLING